MPRRRLPASCRPTSALGGGSNDFSVAMWPGRADSTGARETSGSSSRTHASTSGSSGMRSRVGNVDALGARGRNLLGSASLTRASERRSLVGRQRSRAPRRGSASRVATDDRRGDVSAWRPRRRAARRQRRSAGPLSCGCSAAGRRRCCSSSGRSRSSPSAGTRACARPARAAHLAHTRCAASSSRWSSASSARFARPAAEPSAAGASSAPARRPRGRVARARRGRGRDVPTAARPGCDGAASLRRRARVLGPREGLALEGQPLLRGETELAHSLLYPLLIRPLHLLMDDGARAYEVTKAVNAVIVALAGVPAYLLARRVVTPLLALGVALLVAFEPWTAYASLVMTESLFLPAFTTFVLLVARMLDRPTLGRQLGVLTALAVARGIRPQGVFLAGAVLGGHPRSGASCAAVGRCSSVRAGSPRSRRRTARRSSCSPRGGGWGARRTPPRASGPGRAR